MPEPIFKLKELICETGRKIWQRGYCAGNEGNHSLRLSEDRVLCTPTGISKGELRPDMICTVDMDGKQVDTNNKYKRTSEVLVHLAIYKHRPDVKAVIHSHPPHATAFAVTNIPIPEGIHPEAEVFLGRVKTAPYATPSKQDLPDSILPLIGPQTNTVLMGNHGSVSFSDKSLTDAYYKLEILDAYCRLLILAKQLGTANVLNPQQMTELLEVKQNFGFPDDRLTCSPTGCVGEVNQPFFAPFEGRTPSATTQRDGHGPVSHAEPNTPSSSSSSSSSSQPDGNADFESLVANITNQIMANV